VAFAMKWHRLSLAARSSVGPSQPSGSTSVAEGGVLLDNAGVVQLAYDAGDATLLDAIPCSSSPSRPFALGSLTLTKFKSKQKLPT